MSITEKIRSLCDEAGITINKLEQETGIGRGSVARWDDHEPSVSKVRAVADYFHISIDELLEQKKYPADFSEVDQELFDLMTKMRDRPELRILMHNAERATPEQVQGIADMLARFKQG